MSNKKSNDEKYKYTYTRTYTQTVDKEDAKKRSSDYYNQNKDKLNQKIQCACLGRYSHKNKSLHLKTKIHQNYLKKLNQQTNTESETSESSSDSSSESDDD